MASAVLPSPKVLTTRVDPTSYATATTSILQWACERRRGCYVCAANVHMVMEGEDDPDFARIVNDAALVTPDGMPLVWTLRALGHRNATRVYGPTLMLHVCDAAAAQGIPIGLHGGRPDILDLLVRNLEARTPNLSIAHADAPPREQDPGHGDPDRRTASDAAACAAIRASGARIVFVGLGCPKQERFMARVAPHLDAVLIGVGAAFDLHTGAVPQAPPWLQRLGLEWAFRFAMEPRRLAHRYLWHNPRFVVRIVGQLLRERRPGRAHP